MTVCVALLRGINLAGRTRVSMADLRRLVTELGHADVRTHLQSGNVVFTNSGGSPSRVARDIEQRIAEELDLSVDVLLRTADDMAAVVAANPFRKEVDDISTLHVTFLAQPPDRKAVRAFQAPDGDPARYAIVDREVYLHTPQGYGRSKLSNAYVERKLEVRATTRNWNTVSKLHQLTADRAGS